MRQSTMSRQLSSLLDATLKTFVGKRHVSTARARVMLFGRSGMSKGHHAPLDPFQSTATDFVPISVAASAGASGVVTSDGCVLTGGRGPLGQLGLGDALLSTSSLCTVELPEGIGRPTRIIMGPHANHTALLSSKGETALTGAGAEGQLGLGGGLGIVGSYHGGSQPQAVCTPVRVTVRDGVGIRDAALSKHRSVFLSTNGDVYVCGTDFSGALGLGTTTSATAPVGWHEFDAQLDGSHRFPEPPADLEDASGLPSLAGSSRDNPSARKGPLNDIDIDGEEDFVDADEFAKSGHGLGNGGSKGKTDVNHPAISDLRELQKRQDDTATRKAQSASLLPKFTAVGAGLHFTLAAGEDGQLWFCGRVGTPGKRGFVGSSTATQASAAATNQSSDAMLSSLVPMPLLLPGLGPDTSAPSVDGRSLQLSCGLHHAAITDGRSRMWLFGSGFQADAAHGTSLGVGPHALELERYIGFKPSRLSVSCGPYSTAIIADGKLFLMGRIESPFLVLNDDEVRREEKKAAAAASGGKQSTGGQQGTEIAMKVGEGLGLFEELLRNGNEASKTILANLTAEGFPLSQPLDFVAVLPSPTFVRHQELNGDGKEVLAVALGGAHAIAIVR